VHKKILTAIIVILSITNVFSQDEDDYYDEEITTQEKKEDGSSNVIKKKIGHFMEFSLAGVYAFQYVNVLAYDTTTSPYDFVTIAGLDGMSFQFHFQFRPSISLHMSLGLQSYDFNNFSGIYLDVENTISRFIPFRNMIFFSLDSNHIMSLGTGISLWFALPVVYKGTVNENSFYTNVLLTTALMIRIPALEITFNNTKSLLPFFELDFDINLTSGLQNNAQIFEVLDFRITAKLGLSFHLIQ